MFRRSHYTRRFFSHIEQLSLVSARAVVPEILEIYRAQSVIDVGCGIGTWLKAFAECGVVELLGADGAYVPSDQLVIAPTQFISRDLNQPIVVSGHRGQSGAAERFDLAISLEVAEHLRVERADGLVADLCALADVVLFGAAVPFQGGAGHSNEQWQSYWARKFADNGYQAFDVLRPVIWSSPEVAFWYKQNTLFHVKCDTIAHAEFLGRYREPIESMFDIIHPELFRGKVTRLKNGHPVQKLLNLVRLSGGVRRATVLNTPLSGDEHWPSGGKSDRQAGN